MKGVRRKEKGQKIRSEKKVWLSDGIYYNKKKLIDKFWPKKKKKGF